MENSLDITFFLQIIMTVLISILAWLGTRLFHKIEEVGNNFNLFRVEIVASMANLKSRIDYIEKDISRLQRELERTNNAKKEE